MEDIYKGKISEFASYYGQIVFKCTNIDYHTENGKVKVLEENSPKHLCSKQGFIENTHESIICLPNKIIIKIEDNSLDGVVY